MNPFVNFFSTLYFYFEAKDYLRTKCRWKDVQIKELTKILLYAKKHTSYFGRILENTQITNRNAKQILKELPLLDKNTIRNENANIISDEITDNWPIILNTGGSTGEPLAFPALYKGKHFENINQMMLYIRMGFKLGDTILTFAGRGIDEERQQKHIFWDRCENFPTGKLNMSTLYLNKDNIIYYHTAIESLKPQFIRGYPSGVLEFCKLCDKQNLKINISLKGIYLTSESFSEDDARFIAEHFRCPVYGQYGHTESSIFAYKNPESSFYICSPIYGYTEVLDEEGKQVPMGETGEIVVTGFTQHGVPFIRYRTGDMAIYGGTNEYGEVVLNKLLGRSVDYIINKQEERVYLVGFIFGGHIRAFNHIQTWQIKQDTIGFVTLSIVKASGFDESVEREIIEHFAKKQIDVEIVYVDIIQKTRVGKQRFLIQELK